MMLDGSVWIAVAGLATAIGGWAATWTTYKVQSQKVRLAEDALAFEKSKSDGQITTTDSRALWDESHKLREEYRRDINTLKSELDVAKANLEASLQARIRERDELVSEIQDMKSEMRVKDGQISNLRVEMTRKDEQISHLERDLADATKRVLELEGRASAAATALSTSPMPAAGPA